MTGYLTPYQYARLTPAEVQAVSDCEAASVAEFGQEIADYNPQHLPATFGQVLISTYAVYFTDPKGYDAKHVIHRFGVTYQD